ncbi:hypothetical protein K445DRAFT_18108 [Daldinia sp. EC12]|nr:hypothetical protein K445DRAFT_18108 [Daldinia sp. EC12]
MPFTTRTPSPQPYSPNYELDTIRAPARGDNGFTLAVAHEMDGGRKVKLTSLSGHELPGHCYSGLLRPGSQSPFDSPTSKFMSAAVTRNFKRQKKFMESSQTLYRPGNGFAIQGSPTRPSRKGPGRGIGPLPCYEAPLPFPDRDGEDPAKRFIAEELYPLVGREESHQSDPSSAPVPGFCGTDPCSRSPKRKADRDIRECDSELGTIIEDESEGRQGQMLEDTLASVQRPAKRAKLHPDSRYEEFQSHKEADDPHMSSVYNTGYRDDQDWDLSILRQDFASLLLIALQLLAYLQNLNPVLIAPSIPTCTTPAKPKMMPKLPKQAPARIIYNQKVPSLVTTTQTQPLSPPPEIINLEIPEPNIVIPSNPEAGPSPSLNVEPNPSQFQDPELDKPLSLTYWLLTGGTGTPPTMKKFLRMTSERNAVTREAESRAVARRRALEERKAYLAAWDKEWGPGGVKGLLARTFGSKKQKDKTNS